MIPYGFRRLVTWNVRTVLRRMQHITRLIRLLCYLFIGFPDVPDARVAVPIEVPAEGKLYF